MKGFTVSQISLTTEQQHAIDQLFTRYSPWPLTEPAPDKAVLDLVLASALRAPDHGLLQPARFAIIEGDARLAFGEVLVQAAKKRDPEDDGERFRKKALAAPVIIALGAHIKSNHKVPEIEQLLTVGAGVMNMLNTLHILGFGGFWASGLNAYDDNVKQALGFTEADYLLGFLYVGTPEEVTVAPDRIAPAGFVRTWTGPVSS
jgi:nitroreductase